MRTVIDRYLLKFISRKLSAVLLGTYMELSGHLSQNMMILLAVYVGGQSAVDIYKAIRG